MLIDFNLKVKNVSIHTCSMWMGHVFIKQFFIIIFLYIRMDLNQVYRKKNNSWLKIKTIVVLLSRKNKKQKGKGKLVLGLIFMV